MDAISIEDFLNVELKTGRIVEAQVVENSKKLLQLKVDIGGEMRQIIAGIAPYVEEVGALVGEACVIVSNLEPKMLAGLESQGMLLAGSYEDEEGGKKLSLVQAKDIPPGVIVR